MRHCNTLQHTATHCHTLPHTATHCNTLQRTATHCNTLQHIATHCNTLQRTTTHCNAAWMYLEHACQEGECKPPTYDSYDEGSIAALRYATHVHHATCATHCNTLQHTATHCNTLQHTATHWNTCTTRNMCNTRNTLQHTATHCNTLQHTATHCNTLQILWTLEYCCPLLCLSPPCYAIFVTVMAHSLLGNECNEYCVLQHMYGVAAISRLLKIIGPKPPCYEPMKRWS